MDESLLTFQYIWYIPLGLLICGCAALLLKRLREKNFAALRLFASETLLPRLLEGFSLNRRRMKMGLLFAAAMAIFAALARPQKGFEWQEVNRRGIDILIALDTSRSMLATDTAPNRLERAKIAIDDFVQKLDGDRAGLIPFAGTAFLMVPLTLDYDIVLDSLHEIDINVIPRPGTNISAAIDEARRAFSSSNKEKILVLVSDGEDLEDDALQAASRAASDGIRIFTIGVGTAAGELIPVRGSMGNTGFVKDETGNVVKSRLDEETLNKIAEKTSASYFPLGQGGEGLQKVYIEKLKLLPKSEFAQRMTRKPVDRFEWALFIAFLALTLEFWLKERPSGDKNSLASVLSAGRRLLVRTPLLLALILPASCGPDPRKLYDQADYSRASEAYRKLLEKDPENSPARYNAGTAEYKDGKFDPAKEQFQEALKTDDLALQEKAYFNLGDTFYRKGEASLKSDKTGTIQSWKQALQSYENAIKLNPSSKDAIYNRDLVKKKLEELMKQNPPPSPSPQQSPDQQQQQQQDQSEQQQQKQQENQEQEENQDKQNKKDEEQNQKEDQQQQQQSRPTPAPAPTSGAAGRQQRPMGREDMTKEQAQKLLDSLRNEEISIPPDEQKKREHRADDDVRKDW